MMNHLKGQRDLVSFSGFIRDQNLQQVEWSQTKVKERDIRDVVFENCRLNNVAIENCDIQGLTINGIDVQDLLTNYYENKAPLIDMAREL
ncbi:hypothetical protein ACI2JA_16920 [Alkalihalobacillus sp. NPDC078783]